MARKKKGTEDENNENLQNKSDSDDTFGLPDIEYKPLNREEEPSTPVEEPQAEVSQPEQQQYEYEQKPEPVAEYNFDEEGEGSPAWPKVVGILLVVALALGAVWYFWWNPRQLEKERLAKELAAKEARDKAVQDSLAVIEQARLAAEKHRADSLASIPKEGAIETLSERTMRYYVIIASAVDDDLLMDYARKLSGQGVSSKIIPPFAKYKLFRLAVADSDTFASAQEVADAKKAEYGDALWVLKY